MVAGSHPSLGKSTSVLLLKMKLCIENNSLHLRFTAKMHFKLDYHFILIIIWKMQLLESPRINIYEGYLLANERFGLISWLVLLLGDPPEPGSLTGEAKGAEIQLVGALGVRGGVGLPGTGECWKLPAPPCPPPVLPPPPLGDMLGTSVLMRPGNMPGLEPPMLTMLGLLLLPWYWPLGLMAGFIPGPGPMPPWD